MITVQTNALEAHILTATQRVFGLIHPTAGAAVAEFLNRSDRAVLPVTDAKIYLCRFPSTRVAPEQVTHASFYAIPKDQVLWIKSGYLDASLTRDYQTKRITIYFEGCRVSGEIRLPRDARLSDHLELCMRHKPFQRLHHATITTTKSQQVDSECPQATKASEVVTVHLRNAQGIAELAETRQGAYG